MTYYVESGYISSDDQHTNFLAGGCAVYSIASIERWTDRWIETWRDMQCEFVSELGRDGKGERCREMEREVDRDMNEDGKRESWRVMEKRWIRRWREMGRERDGE